MELPKTVTRIDLVVDRDDGQTVAVQGGGLVEPAPDNPGRARVRVAPEARQVLLAAIGPAKRFDLRPLLLGVALGIGLSLAPTAARRLMPAPSAATPKPSPCSARIDEALAHDRWSDALARTRECGAPASGANAYFAAGDFAQASTMFAAARLREPTRRPSLDETEAHLFAGEPVRAAAAAHEMIDRFYAGPATTEKRTLECIAAKIDAIVANPDEAGPDRGSCVQRPSALGSAPRTIAAPYDRAVANPFSAYVGTRGRLRDRPLAIESRLVGTTSASDIERAAWSSELALFHAWSGARDRAEPFFVGLDQVARDLANGFHREEERPFFEAAMSVAAAAALYLHDDLRVDTYARLGEAHSAGVVLQVRRTLSPKQPWEAQIEDDHWVDHAQIFTAARGGDGAALAAVLVQQHTTGADTLARVFPRLERNQDAVRAWFDDAFPGPCLDCGATELLGHLVERRNVALVLDRRAEAEYLAPVIRRFSDARLAPRTADIVDDLESFFAPR